MVNILIIADDLTGALDSAVAFAHPGTVVRVLRDVDHLTADVTAGVDVLCINTNSREGSAAQAVDKIRTIAQRLDLDSIPTLIKKVDSRLKGHIKAETAALADLSGRTDIIAVPAIPDMGRIQKNGFLVGVGSGSGLANPCSMTDKFPDGSVIPDVDDLDDLDRLIASAPKASLWVGARGLAFALARVMARLSAQPKTDPLKSEFTSLHGPLWVAVGSRDPITVAQAEQLARTHPIQMAPNGVNSEVHQTGAVTTLQLTKGAFDISGYEAGRQLSTSLCAALGQYRPRTLLVCGGETANAILDRLEINTFDVITEVCEGLPLCRGIAPWGPIDIVTKSGGFGDVNLLTRLAHLVECEQDDLPMPVNSESL